MNGFVSELRSRIAGIVSLTPDQEFALEGHARLLSLWNRRMNLTSLKQPEEILERHFCESLFLAAKLPAVSLTVADLGSGAGFPGLPVAVARPDCRITLVEANSRKCVFLREASRSLKNVTVVEGRVKGIKERFDWIISRAVRWQDLIPLLPSLSDRFAFLLGEDDAGELHRQGFVSDLKISRLPWGMRRVLIVGSVSRGTSRRP